MIEKLPEIQIHSCAKINKKLNEVIDAVNGLQLAKDAMFFAIRNIQNRITALDNPTYHKAEPKPADPYAEQRKWIGYLCWFWDDEYYLKTAGVLEEITTIEEEFHYAKQDTCTVWKHCEPVKPDDDIIYKGGNNE